MFAVVFLTILAAAAAGLIVFARSQEDKSRALKLKLGAGAAGALFLFVLMSSAVYVIDEGESAVFVSFGDAYAEDSSAGVGIMRPWASKRTYYTRIQSFDQKGIETRTGNNVSVQLDLTVMWAADPSKLVDTYSNIATDNQTLRNGFVIPIVRAAIRKTVSKYSFEELNANQQKVEEEIFLAMKDKMAAKNCVLDNVLLRNIVPPPEVEQAAKEALATEIQIRREEKGIILAEKQAERARKEAEGLRDAQQTINRTLTPLYVQFRSIQAIEKLAESDNTTFAMIPMAGNTIFAPQIQGSPLK